MEWSWLSIKTEGVLKVWIPFVNTKPDDVAPNFLTGYYHSCNEGPEWRWLMIGGKWIPAVDSHPNVKVYRLLGQNLNSCGYNPSYDWDWIDILWYWVPAVSSLTQPQESLRDTLCAPKIPIHLGSIYFHKANAKMYAQQVRKVRPDDCPVSAAFWISSTIVQFDMLSGEWQQRIELWILKELCREWEDKKEAVKDPVEGYARRYCWGCTQGNPNNNKLGHVINHSCFDTLDQKLERYLERALKDSHFNDTPAQMTKALKKKYAFYLSAEASDDGTMVWDTYDQCTHPAKLQRQNPMST